MKKILGLDLGTNSIGWALVEQSFENKQGKILGLGSRIIPMSEKILSEFGIGNTKSQTADRTKERGTRKLYQRDNLRRERLHRVLNILDFLPKHYSKEIDFDFHKGQYINYSEPKLPYFKNEQGKYEFLFKDSFNEMVEEFKKTQPDLFYLKSNGKETKIPYDWTIYYLRKKALTQKISKEELAWLILNFNQKRGYYQLSEDEQENDENKTKEFVVLKVGRLIETGEIAKKTGDKLFKVYFVNGWEYDKPTARPQDWEGKTKEFIVTTSETKDGKIKRSYKAVDSEQDWIAIKKKTEQEIGKSGKTVGTYIYETLLTNPTQKIRGKLVRTIERKFYKDELLKILLKQITEHKELKDKELYNSCINELYPNNEAHRRNIENRDFQYLFMDDIIFYQRPLKTKTHLISDCSLEYRIRQDTKEKVYLKCIAKSNPLFQEFRLWQFLANLRIYERERDGKYDVDVTNELLKTDDEWVKLFEWLNDKDKINQKQLLTYFKLKVDKFRWNYVDEPEKEYPCNETRAKFLVRLKKFNIDNSFLTQETIYHLWHILYSVTNPDERNTIDSNGNYKGAISKYAQKHNLSNEFIESFAKFPAYKRDYGSFSEKAIKKLLPLMRKGKYWNWDNFDNRTKERIDKLLTAEFDEKIRDRVREKSIHLQKNEDFKGVPLWLASYIVYDKHSEASDTKKWNTSRDITDYLNPKLKGSFKQHSLRNPIVEQVLTETLRVVKDIWEEYGNGEESFFDEIHIELGREMKNDKKTRERITKQVTENENTNQRIKAVLSELLNDGIDVRPYSPSQQEILKIYEEGIYQNPTSNYSKVKEDEIIKIRKNINPNKSEIQRYKLWLEQGYISPYTGKTIMLSELFTHKYQIEHIFPQSRYFDDSLSNKIICESEVNQLKDNKTAYEFISEFQGSKVDLGGGQTVTIFTLPTYEQHIKTYFSKNKVKRENLLSSDIPESFINRQMNDSRYISKVVKNLLSKIVREEDEQEVTSKHIVPITGAITSQMKQDWGLNDVWNDIITPRFERMNELTNSNDFGGLNPNTNKFLPTVPDSISKGFSKKRIDHRHHALDALVIACITKDHVNYITSINTERKNYSLVSKLRNIVEVDKTFKNSTGLQNIEKRKVAKEFIKPWESFTTEAANKLKTTIVSFKQNTRVINKTKNKYQKWVKDENGLLKKKIVPQTKGDNWAIRRSLHQETIHGKIKLRLIKEVSFLNGVKEWKNLVDKTLKNKIKRLVKVGNNEKEIIKHFKSEPYSINGNTVAKVMVYYFDEDKSATRKSLDTSFDENTIKTITDTGIQKILLNHLNSTKYQNQIDEKGSKIASKDLAFNSEGIDELNKNIKQLNNGKNHQPIFNVRKYEALGNKFSVGINGNKGDKFVVAATGTNLFFAIYWNEEKKKREFETIPLNEVIEHQKQSAFLPKEQRTFVPVNSEKGNFLFSLSPNDLVYVPTQEEIENPNIVDFLNLTKEQTIRIYKFTDSSDTTANFVPVGTSDLLFNLNYKEQKKRGLTYLIQNEFGVGSPQSKNQKSIDKKPLMIKDICWKLETNRLGKIESVLKVVSNF